MEVNVMSEFITLLGTFVTAVIGWAGDAIAFIVETPYLLVPSMVFFISGAVFGIVRRVSRG